MLARQTGVAVVRTVVLAGLLLAGCVTGTSQTAQGRDGGTLDGAASDNLAVARGMISAGQYSQAIPRLLHVLEVSSNARSDSEGHYLLGVAYEAISSPGDAVQHYSESMRLWPESPNNSQARAALQRIQTGRDPRTAPAIPAEIAARIQALEAGDTPGGNAFAGQLELADLYWRSGQFEKATGLYATLLKDRPGLLNDMTIRDRVEQQPDGSLVALTPDEVLRRQNQKEPLAIYNLSGFRSGRNVGFSRTFEEQIYNVTGEVTNRGAGNLRNVQLVVTIYNFGNDVLDTQTIPIGVLQPGAKRPFSVRFTGFDDIENVERYDVVGTYEQ